MKIGKSAATVAGVLLCMASLFSQAVYAQTAAPASPGTERLQAQMQSAAQPAAATAAAAAVPNPNCTLMVPVDPLTATGLATPYQLVATDPGQGPCDEANPAQSAFVQAAIFDPATNTIAVYNPLEIGRAHV